MPVAYEVRHTGSVVIYKVFQWFINILLLFVNIQNWTDVSWTFLESVLIMDKKFSIKFSFNFNLNQLSFQKLFANIRSQSNSLSILKSLWKSYRLSDKFECGFGFCSVFTGISIGFLWIWCGPWGSAWWMHIDRNWIWNHDQNADEFGWWKINPCAWR